MKNGCDVTGVVVKVQYIELGQNPLHTSIVVVSRESNLFISTWRAGSGLYLTSSRVILSRSQSPESVLILPSWTFKNV